MGRESGNEGEWSVESYVRSRRLIGDLAPTGNGEATSFTFTDLVAFLKKKPKKQQKDAAVGMCERYDTREEGGGRMALCVPNRGSGSWIAMETAASG